MKGIITRKNVQNPQGQEHGRIFIEWDGAKDTLANCKKAGFEKGAETREGVECILNRRCVIVKVMVCNEIRVVLVVNSGVKHNYKDPSALPDLSPLRHNIRCNESKEEQDRPSFEECLLKFDFASADATKLVYNTTLKKIVGLSFHKGSTVIGTASFVRPIPEVISPLVCSPSLKIEQHIVAGVFTSDLAFD